MRAVTNSRIDVTHFPESADSSLARGTQGRIRGYLVLTVVRTRLRDTPIHPLRRPSPCFPSPSPVAVIDGSRRWLLASVVGALLGMSSATLAAQQDTVRIAAEPVTCDAGVVTGIDVVRGSVFDPDSTEIAPLVWTYRLMNVLHVRTQESFVRREILLREGECFDPFLATESERLLESYTFLTNARVVARPDGTGGQRLTVSSQDEWSTQVDVGVTYDAGPNIEKIQVTEENFLGQGVLAEFTHRERLETRTQAVRVSTPRLFGRTDASLEIGRDRPGNFFNQFVGYPFIGEAGRYSLRQGYSRGTRYYSYGTAVDDVFSQVVVPEFREVIEFSAARRFGGRGKSLIAGISASRDVTRFGAVSAATNDDLSDLAPYPHAGPVSLVRQLEQRASSRIWLHLGARNLRFEEYFGIDGLRDRLLVGLGYRAAVSAGRGTGLFVPEEADGREEFFARANGAVTTSIGSSILHGEAYVESRRDGDGWEDVIADAELVALLRHRALSGQTLFLRATFAGGWHTSMPYQMSLGGREGMRFLPEDRYPGGRTARFVVEDRIVFPWPANTLDLGMTLFADVGRVWPGDAPFGIDSGWRKGVGAGVRIGFPRRTRNAWRADLAFPLDGPERTPILRVTFELNRLAQGFFIPDHTRSRRFALGADSF